MFSIKFRTKLFRAKDPFDTESTNAVFFRAVKENCRFQYDNCKEYRSILDYYGVKPESLCSYEDIAKIPFLPTLLFKHHKLFSVSPRKMLIRATSSGTKGVFSEIGYDTGGLFCALKMVLKKMCIRDRIIIINSSSASGSFFILNNPPFQRCV